MTHVVSYDQWRRQDFSSSGAYVGRANNECMEARSAEFARNVHRGAKRRDRAKRAPRREAPSPREAREAESRRAEWNRGVGFGEGARWAPPQEIFWNFESATVQFGSFWKCNFTFINQLTISRIGK